MSTQSENPGAAATGFVLYIEVAREIRFYWWLTVAQLNSAPNCGINMENELTLRIVLEKPPRDVDFGLQKGRGSSYETSQKQRFEGKDLTFEFTARVKPGARDSTPNFLGPFVQGPPGERFIYIDIGTYAGQTQTHWSRRLKVPLRGITWDMIDRVLADEESLLETRLPGTGRDGGPTCATVKPFPGWKLVRSRLLP